MNDEYDFAFIQIGMNLRPFIVREGRAKVVRRNDQVQSVTPIDLAFGATQRREQA